MFYDTLGKSYISIALKAAHEADPNAKLYINEYNLESKGKSDRDCPFCAFHKVDLVGPKIDAMVQLVKDLQAEGVHIDGVGFESHLILGGFSASDLKTNMERITALGLEVAVTELDIRIELPATDADLMQQKTDYMDVANACKSVSGCVGVTVWDYTDKVRLKAYSVLHDLNRLFVLQYSWIPSTFPGSGAACAWDAVCSNPHFHAISKRDTYRISSQSPLTMEFLLHSDHTPVDKLQLLHYLHRLNDMLYT